MDDPSPDHLRLRDSAVLGRFGRFLPAFGRRVLWLGAPRAAGVSRGDGGRPCLDGHAHPARGRLGMGELEVPEASGGGRHHLRPVDADPEARAGRRSQDLDRCVAGGCTHNRRRGMRRRRRRRECVPGGITGAPADRRRRGRGRGRSALTPASKASSRRGGRAAPASPCCCATAGCPGRTTGGDAEATPPPLEQRVGKRRRPAGAGGAWRRSHTTRAA